VLARKQLVQAFDQARASLKQGNLQSAQFALTNFRANFSPHKECLVFVEEALAIVNKAADELEAEAARSLHAIIDKLREKIVARAPAADFDALLKELSQLSVPPGMRINQTPTISQEIHTTRDFIARWQDYTAHLAAKNPERAMQSLNLLAHLATITDILPRSEILALQESLNESRRKALATLTEELSALIQRLPAIIRADTKAAELDSFLQTLANIRRELDQDYSSGTQEDRRRIEVLRRFAASWQDYLAETAAHEPNAQQTARYLLSDASFDTIFPRSKLREAIESIAMHADAIPDRKTAGPPPPESLTLATLDTFVAELALVANPPRAGQDPALTALSLTLTNLQQSASQIASGDLSAAQQFLRMRVAGSPVPQYRDAIARVRAELAAAAVIVIAAPPVDLVKEENENIFSYLMRVLHTANERRDWALAQRTVDALGALGANGEAGSFRLFFAAQNFEAAGQFPSAVQHYLACLRTGNHNLPAAEIGARLKALQEQHPEAYAQGEKMPFASPAPIDARTGEPVPILRSTGSPPSTPRTR